MLKKPLKIEDIGLAKFLDDSADKHFGYGYRDFVGMLDRGLGKSDLAKAFGVNRKAIYRWLEVYKEEQTNAT